MSPVPGGMSMSRYSGSSQCTSERNCWRALCSIGPRQTTGLSSGTKLPIEIILKPWASGGMMSRSSTTVGFSRTPSMRGIEKPQTSASRRPTVWPRLASIAARLTVVVDLPTPPLPLPMARTVVAESGPAIGAMSLFCRRPPTRDLRSSSVIAPRLICTSVISGKRSFSLAGRTSWKNDFRGQPGIVRARSTVTRDPCRSMPRTMLSSTMLRWISGSLISARTERIWSMVGMLPG